MSGIQALTLWQPWATLIAIGVKHYETRSWRTSYRGPLAVHAGVERRGLALCRGETEIEQALDAAGLSLDTLPLGGIVATADLVDCRSTTAILAAGDGDLFGDYSAGRFGWQLANVRALAVPIACRGKQGLWTPGAEVQSLLVADKRCPTFNPAAAAVVTSP